MEAVQIECSLLMIILDMAYADQGLHDESQRERIISLSIKLTKMLIFKQIIKPNTMIAMQ